MPSLLTLEGVSLLSPEGSPLFRDLDWELPRGGRFHLVGGEEGRSEAFLRLCCGILQPDSGKVVLDGRPLNAPSGRHPLLERGALGYVPSDGGLAVNLSLQDNIALPLRFALGLDRDTAQRRSREALERAGLLPFAQRRPRVPGDGQCWLASLVRASVRKPVLWLVDRPSGGLDAHSIQAARSILEEAGQDPSVTLLLAGGKWMDTLGGDLTIQEDRISSGRQA